MPRREIILNKSIWPTSCYKKASDITKPTWLLSHSANPHVGDKLFRWTPLHSAACFGHVEVCQLLLQYKADNNVKDSDGKTPLHLASEAGHVYVARLLLEHGADVNARDNYRDTPLHRAAMQ